MTSCPTWALRSDQGVAVPCGGRHVTRAGVTEADRRARSHAQQMQGWPRLFERVSGHGGIQKACERHRVENQGLARRRAGSPDSLQRGLVLRATKPIDCRGSW
jgi:hypothetical protein